MYIYIFCVCVCVCMKLIDINLYILLHIFRLNSDKIKVREA